MPRYPWQTNRDFNQGGGDQTLHQQAERQPLAVAEKRDNSVEIVDQTRAARRRDPLARSDIGKSETLT
jgi:hypothetical protein